MDETKSKSSTALGKGCAILFLFPFLLIGLLALGKGILTYLADPRFTEEVIAMLGVGIMFTGVGTGFLVLTLSGGKKSKEANQLETKYPEEPWMWKEEWVNGRIPSSTPFGVIVAWVFAIAFCGFSIPMLYKAIPNLLEGGEPGMWIALLFPLAGLAMLAGAIYSTLRWFKFGRAYCDLITHPGVVGGYFTGVVWAGYRHRDDDTAKAILTCCHKYETGSGKDRSTRRDIQWQEEHIIHSDGIGQDDQGKTALPVKMYIPRDCKQTTLDDPDDCIEWELKVHSDIPGIDFHADFIVPVFVTEESSSSPPETSSDEEQVSSRAPYKPTILIQEHMDGIDLVAPPRRNIGTAIGVTIFLTIWTAVLGFIVQAGAGILFFLVFGLFEVLIGWFVMWLWFGKINLTIRNSQIELTKTMLGISSTKTQDGNNLTEVNVKVGMTSNNRAYYRIILIAPDNKRTVSLSGIRNKQEADDLAARIRKAVGMDHH